MWSSLVLLLGAEPAEAGIHTLRMCAQYLVDYVDARLSAQDCGTPDADPACTLDDDYFRDNDVAKPALGTWMIWKNNAGATVFADYTEDDGTYAGCSPQKTVDSANGPFTVQILSKADVFGTTFRVENNDDEGFLWGSEVRSVSINSSTDHTESWGPHKAWNVAAALSFALSRRTAGIASGNTFTFFTCGCPAAGDTCLDPATDPDSNCHKPGTNNNYIGLDTLKGFVSHELGHQLAETRDGGTPGPVGYTAVSDVDCPDQEGSHAIASAERQDAAIIEGIANYYAAVVWNASDQNDCELLPASPIDWDGDGEGDYAGPWPCQGALESESGFTVADRDYYGNYCTEHGPDLLNRAVELDWTRFWRNLDRYEGLDTTDIYDIYDNANPSGGDAGTEWDADESSGQFADFPESRMENAAIGLGWETAWRDSPNDEFEHGIWRP